MNDNIAAAYCTGNLPLAIGIAIATLMATTPADAAPKGNAQTHIAGDKCITEKEVVAAQKAWGNGIVEIGKTFTQGGNYVSPPQPTISTASMAMI